jgi:hypothetical protein
MISTKSQCSKSKTTPPRPPLSPWGEGKGEPLFGFEVCDLRRYALSALPFASY